MINPLGKSLAASARKSLYRWRQRGPDIDSGAGNVTRFGERSAMSYDGDIIAIAGQQDSIGFVRVYKWDGGKYDQIGSELTYGQVGDEFGYWVDLNYTGTRLLVCAAPATNRAFIYHFENNDWVLKQTFQKVGTQPVGISCISISGSGDRLVLGEGFFGFGYLWQWDGTQWVSLGNPTVGTTRLQGSGTTISGDGLIVGSASQGFRIFSVNTSGVAQLLDSDGSGITTQNTVPKRSWLSEDGLFFVDEEGVDNFGGAELARVRRTATSYLVIPDARTPAMNLINTMLSKTGRMISNQVGGGIYYTRVYDLSPVWPSSYIKVGQDIPHTGTLTSTAWSIARAYPAISGDGSTIGRGQSSRPNSFPTRSFSQSYTVHRIAID